MRESEMEHVMTMFKLTLEKTYYRKGFFNVTVDFDRFVSSDGPVELVLGTSRQTIESRIDRGANRNGTPRIMGGAKLRDWFQANYAEGDVIEVDLSSFSSIQIGG